MIVALFGVTCVGKTTVGKIISDELHYDFYDLDAELKLYYNDTITNIQRRSFCRHEYDSKKIDVLNSILSKCSENTIIAVSPIYYTARYKKQFRIRKVVSIELQDSPVNIANRMVYTDDDDNIIENYEADIKNDIKDVKCFISRYKRAHSNIENKYNIDGKNVHEAAKEIIVMIKKITHWDAGDAAFVQE